MKSYAQDQAKFKRACKNLLKRDYVVAADEAREVYTQTLAQLKGEFIAARVNNKAKAAANAVMARWVKEVTGITSIYEYLKAEAQAKADKKQFTPPKHIKAQALPGNKKKTNKRPQVQGFSLNDALNETFDKAAA